MLNFLKALLRINRLPSAYRLLIPYLVRSGIMLKDTNYRDNYILACGVYFTLLYLVMKENSQALKDPVNVSTIQDLPALRDLKDLELPILIKENLAADKFRKKEMLEFLSCNESNAQAWQAFCKKCKLPDQVAKDLFKCQALIKSQLELL